MNDQRAVEVITKALGIDHWGGDVPHIKAPHVLAALRAEGYDLYRPDECETVEVEDGGEFIDYQTGDLRQAEPLLRGRMIHDTRCLLRVGSYRLVPVGGEG